MGWWLLKTEWKNQIHVPNQQPFIDGFSLINHPANLGYPHDYGNPHIKQRETNGQTRSSSYGGKDQGRPSAYDVWPVSWIFFTRTMFSAAGNLTKPTCQLFFLMELNLRPWVTSTEFSFYVMISSWNASQDIDQPTVTVNTVNWVSIKLCIYLYNMPFGGFRKWGVPHFIIQNSTTVVKPMGFGDPPF